MTNVEVKERCDIACEILHDTNDGDDLSPDHLYLVQQAVNGFLSDAGYQAFRDLQAQVKRGYKKPWFHGIEHLTYDHAGYVYWKGLRVEHFDPPWAYSQESKVQAVEVARRCRLLEERGVKPSVTSVIWNWQD